MTLATLHDEAKTETINLSFAKHQNSREAKVGPITNPYRYTDIVFLMGVHGKEVRIEGVFIPPFVSTGTAWTTSSGLDPGPTLELWERTGQRLQFNDETGSLTSVNVASYAYRLVPGVPLSQIVYYTLVLREGNEF